MLWQVESTAYPVLLIAALVLAVWLPCELVQSYCDAFVFKNSSAKASLQLARVLDAFFGIIATAGILCALERDAAGQPPLVGPSFRDGLSFWGRMWWANFVFGLMLALGFLALIVPGVLVLVRGSLLSAVVVQEDLTGLEALKRSFALTQGRFWRLAGWLIGAGALTCLAGCPLLALTAVVDNWVANALLTAGFDVIAAYMTVFTWVVLCRVREACEPQDEE